MTDTMLTISMGTLMPAIMMTSMDLVTDTSMA